LLSLRPLSTAARMTALAVMPSDSNRESINVWAGLEGPTRVINLLDCKNLAAFESAFVTTFNPKPWLPNLCRLPEPSFESTLSVLKHVLPQIKSTPLILYLEDINRIHLYTSSGSSEASNTIMTLFTTITENSGLVVGNSSAVLSFLHFQKYSHTGLRTHRYFFPTLSSDDPELLTYAGAGAHLWATDFVPPGPCLPSVASQIELWNGNVKMLSKAARDSADPHLALVKEQVLNALEEFALNEKDPLFHFLIAKDANKTHILSLRRQLLQMLVDHNSKVPLKSLPNSIIKSKIHLQLAALDLVSFRTDVDHQTHAIVEYIVPYYPVVLKEFRLWVSEHGFDTPPKPL
jgi:hypothetical protein